MLHISRTGILSEFSKCGASCLEKLLADWCRSVELALSTRANCTISIWSNEFYCLAAVASFTAEGNEEAELVVDIAFHRKSPDESQVNFTVELCRENGPPIASLPGSEIPLDSSGFVSQRVLDGALDEVRKFLFAQSQTVARELAAMARRY